jgi:uncharacterized membrane protein
MKGEEKSKKDSLFARYNSLLAKYPLIINALQRGIITAGGVFASQAISYTQKHEAAAFSDITFNLGEVWVMVAINMFWITPILLTMINFLATYTNNPVEKLVIDQLIISPPFTTSIVGLRYILLGGKTEEIWSFLWTTMPRAQITSWFFWIPTRFLIMSYIPPIYQLLMNSLGAFVWNILFSLLLNS